MQFFSIFALAAGIATASAWSSSPINHLIARGYDLEDASNFFTLKARGYDLDVADYTFLHVRGYDIEDMADFAILQARKKNKVLIPRNLQKDSISAKELESTQELAEAALKGYQGTKAGAEARSAEVIYGWHNDGSEDPLEHITMRPDVGKKIHVHRDGSWTAGKQ